MSNDDENKENIPIDIEDIKRQLIADQEKNLDKKQKQSGNNKIIVDENELKIKIQNNDFSEYIIKTIKKTVKCEDSLIRQIVDTAFSAKTDDPINLGIIAPTSKGKTYPVIETLQYFPDEDVMYIGGMSTKALVRQNGILVDKYTNTTIEPKIKELKLKIATCIIKKKQ